ncbi:MAG: hypothetical protein P9M00_03265 [Candidatus Tritonobacter lacicola]|nr:hypothetical protein [Candidatus Tritonobacter lacicola]
MVDRFEEVMERFLIPIGELGEPSDSIYFLKNDGSLVYCEGYCHPPGGFYGMILKYPKKNGHIVIHGRRFDWTHRRFEEGDLVIVPYEEQVKKCYDIDPGLTPAEQNPVFVEHFVKFDLADFRGYFDPRRSLKLLMEENPRLLEDVRRVSELLDISLDDIGCTGSLAYGHYYELDEDVDLVIFGSAVQNRSVVQTILDLKEREPERRVFELGKFWPMRFFDGKTLICPFFKYADPAEIPLKDCTMSVINEHVQAFGTVVDDLHAIYLPAVVKMAGVILDGETVDDLPLIIYDGAQRGEYYKGDRLGIDGRLVEVREGGRKYRALLSTKMGDIKRSPQESTSYSAV